MRAVVLGAAGGVGSAVAYSLVVLGVADEIVLVDPLEDRLWTQVWDLEQLRGSVRPVDIRPGCLSDVAAADVVVVAASVPARPGAPRMDALAGNRPIVSELAKVVAEGSGSHGTRSPTLIVVTNPVDPLVTLLQRESGLDRHCVLGYNANDSLRYRFGLAKALGLGPDVVEAWVLGEHGDRCVPLHEPITVRDRPVHVPPGALSDARHYLASWYGRWAATRVERTTTWTTGHGVATMIGALLGNSGALTVASTVLDGEYGVHGVALGVPVRCARGAVTVECWALSSAEDAAMTEGAAHIRAAIAATDPVSP